MSTINFEDYFPSSDETYPFIPHVALYDTLNFKSNIVFNGSVTLPSSSTYRPATTVLATQSSGYRADYYTTGTNDAVQIQAALTAATGGRLLVHPGIYTVNSNLSIPNNTAVYGMGYGTLLNVNAGVAIKFNGVTRSSLHDLRIDGSTQAVNGLALQINNSSDITLDHVWVLNCVGFAVFIGNSDSQEDGKIRIINSYLSGKGNNDVLGGGPANATSTLSELIITNNYIVQGIDGGGTDVNAIDIVAMNKTVIANNVCQGAIILGGEKIPHTDVIVSNNQIRNSLNSTYGRIAVLTSSNAGQSADSTNISLIGNQIINGNIYIQGQSSTSNRSRKIIISKNNILGLLNDPTTESNWGLDLNYLADVQIEGNIIDGSLRGIYLNNIQGVDVSNNRIINCTTSLVTNAPITILSGHNNIGVNPDTLFTGGNITGATVFDRANGKMQTYTFTGNTIATIVAGLLPGDILIREFTMGGAGSFTYTRASNEKLLGGGYVPTTSVGAKDILTESWDGTNWIEVSRALNIS